MIIIKRKKRKEKEIKKLIKMTMETILLMSWHYKTIRMRNNNKTKHVEKEIIISRNKNNNYNSNNNELKDEQNHRFEIRFIRVFKIQALHKNLHSINLQLNIALFTNFICNQQEAIFIVFNIFSN